MVPRVVIITHRFLTNASLTRARVSGNGFSPMRCQYIKNNFHLSIKKWSTQVFPIPDAFILQNGYWDLRPYTWNLFPHDWPVVRVHWWCGNPHVTGEWPRRNNAELRFFVSLYRSVKRNFDVLFNLWLNKRLSNQSRHRWFETPLWHCTAITHTGWSKTWNGLQTWVFNLSRTNGAYMSR